MISEPPPQNITSVTQNVSDEHVRYPSSTNQVQSYNLGELQSHVDSSLQNNNTRSVHVPSSNQGSSLQSNVRQVRRVEDTEHHPKQQTSHKKLIAENNQKTTIIPAKVIEKSDSKPTNNVRIPADKDTNRIFQDIQLSPNRNQQRTTLHESPAIVHRSGEVSYPSPSNQKRQQITEKSENNSPNGDTSIKIT